MPIKFEYFTCSCLTPEHTMRVWLDVEDGEAYIEIYKHTPSFFRRIIKAIKYLFQVGEDCNTVSETVLDRKNVQQLKLLLSQIEEK